nr:JAB domain-containing protein [Clostridia bacterium]
MNTYIENTVRFMGVRELISQAGGTCEDNSGMLSGMFNFEDFLDTLPKKKRAEAVALVELYKRSLSNSEVKSVRESTDIYRLLTGVMTGLACEEFWLITMNQAAKVISRRRISVGGIDQTTVDVRQIMKYAIRDNATQIAVSHNHPSGNLKPSNEDIAVTNRIKKAAELLCIRLVDHVIVTNGNFYSFHDHGLL